MKTTEAFLTDNFEYISEEYNPDLTDTVGGFREICARIKRIDYLPIKNLNIQFSSDTWDFSPMISNEYQSTKQLTFYFKHVHHKYKDILKFYVYDSITRGKIKIQTMVGNLRLLRLFTRYLGREYIYSLDFVTLNHIKSFTNHIEELGRKTSTIFNYVVAIKDLFKFYERKMTNKELFTSSKEINDHYAKFYGISGYNTPVKDRTPDIPNDYFNSYLSTAIKIMNSDDAYINRRGYASLFVLLSQTGLRLSQALTLKTNAIRTVGILDNTKTAHFMEFIIIKRHNGNNRYHKSETILNDLGYKAYTTLVDIYKSHRKKIKTDYLFCPTTGRTLPVSDTTFERNIIDFCFENGRDIGCINVSDKYPELSSYTVDRYKELYPRKRKSLFEGYKDDDVISYVTSHQFRVHLCTEFYYKNIPLSIIQHYMSHLSEDMADYYVRRSEYSEKEEEYANSVLKVIVEEGTKPLGAHSNALISKIDEFIEKGNFNIKKDIDTIISELKRRMPIKEKLGGICIKSGPKRDCSKDSATDEFYCAYGVCPNHFHLYTMADITYTRCKAMVKTIEHNKIQGFTRQSQKEKNKLIHVAKTSLVPELNQLKEELSKKGPQWIKENHPNLEDIINNIETITEEVNTWIA